MSEQAIRPVVKMLYDTAVQMEAQGKEITFTSLNNESGNCHSRRDVSAALDLFRDEKRKIEATAYPMPEPIKNRVGRLVELMWAEQCQWHCSSLEKDKEAMERSIGETRADRDRVFEENEALAKRNQELVKELASKIEEVENLKAEIKRLTKSLTESEIAIAGLTSKNEAQDRSLKELNQAFQSFCKLKGGR